MEMATEEGQTRGLKLGNEVVQGDTTKSEIEATLGKSKLVRVVEDRGVIRGLRQGEDECYQLVGRLREVWSELDVVKTHTSNPRCCQERRKQDVIFSFLMEEVCELVKYTCDVWEMNRKPERWKRGTSCKRGRLRKLSKEWLMKRRAWRKDSESEHLSDRMSVILKRIKDVLQQMVIGECSYSAYMGETVGDSADMRGMDTKRADECVTKKEWDELVKHVGNGSESGEQEHNQEDSGQHDQEETQEVESEAQSGGNEQGEPTGLREEAQENPVPACRDALPLSINGHMPSLVKAKHDQTVNFFSRSPLSDPSPLWTGESVPLFPSSPASSKPWSSSSDTDSLPPSCAKWDVMLV
ncbi:hypothetical protein IGI04_043037 [Brassica rapa subsp. trilocularis]|uniref:Uncharacterized protein n=1 Tax=Brassica rapa subsp. trilocularis TaxID=1813537 RepID=A0ABQ7KGY7_BRACM|nr:hypothetical protein IGI04_043037 [Brassica rapa subsp. trilocularis]